MEHAGEPTALDDDEITRVAKIILDELKREPDVDRRIAVAALLRVATAIIPHIECPACRAIVRVTASRALAATALPGAAEGNQHVH